MCILSVISGVVGSYRECRGTLSGSGQGTGRTGLEDTDYYHRSPQFSWACGVLLTLHPSVCKNCCSPNQLDEKEHPLYVVLKGGGGLQGVEGSFAARPNFAAGLSSQRLHCDGKCQRFCHCVVCWRPALGFDGIG